MKKKNICNIRIRNKDAEVLQSLCNLESHKKGADVKPSEYVKMLIRKEADYAGEYIGLNSYEEDDTDKNPVGFIAD